MRVKYPDVKDAHDFVADEFHLFAYEVIEQIAFNGSFGAFASDECIEFFDSCGEFTQLHWRQVRDARAQKLDYVDDKTDKRFAALTVDDLLELIDEYFSLAALVVCARYQNHHPQLKRERCKTEQDLYYEGDELGLTLNEDLITLETFNRDINQYRDKYHRNKQHA